MNSKWHLYISLGKSVLRIIGYVMIGNSFPVTWPGCWVLIAAEVGGIIEELKDNR